MRKATDLEIKQFISYRSIHIGLVERLGALVFDENYSDHDWDKCTCDEDELNVLALRNAQFNGSFNPTGEDKKVMMRLPAKHVKMNKHHPEYWDDVITINNFSDEDPPQCHASKMPYRWIREMCCDWAAVALKRNKPIFKWYNETCTGDNPRFVFTDNQKSYIIECLKKIESVIEKEHITYPGIKYDAKQIEPVEELKESMTKSDKDQILHFADEVKNHGLEYHDMPGHVAWDGVIEKQLDCRDLVLGKKMESRNTEDRRLYNEMKYMVEDQLVKENKISECEMSGGFEAQAPEKVNKIVDPSGLLDQIKSSGNKEKEVTEK